ncbi:MAG: alpha/beta fold hydrolase [Roseivirga sp.]|nr:alpha/beta fold hydrolase [Roseivirga sp.]
MARTSRFGLCLWGLVCLLTACQSEPDKLFTIDGSIEVNGSELYYKRYALGKDSLSVWQRKAIVMVHGGPVMDHSYFIPHLDELAKEYQLFFYDQRAAGRSSIEVDSAFMNLAGFVEDIEQLRKKFGFKKINLLGHSWGGLISMKYAIKYAGNLDHLILSGSMAPSVKDWETETSEIGKRVTPEETREREALLASGALGAEDPREAVRKLLLQSFRPQMYDRANLDSLKLYVPIDFMKRNQVYAMLRPDMASFNLYPEMERITCPTLMIYGETEPANTIYTDKIVGRVKSSELVVIKKAGHFPFIEQRAAYSKAVLDFLVR